MGSTGIRDPLQGGRAQRRQRRGFTMVELALGMTVFAIALGGLTASILSSRELSRSSDETSTAYEAARRQLERIQNEALDDQGLGGFATVFRRYNDSAADDGGLASPMGANFAVVGLDPQDADADGMCGRIEFPQAAGAPATVLREDIQEPSFGLPRDLNANGTDTDTTDLSDGSYVLLPVRVRVDWRGVSGNRSIALDTFMAAR